MKTINSLRAAIILIGILLSACTPAANSTTDVRGGGGKGLAEVTFTGVIEDITGDQWTINGQTISVDTSVLRDGPFAVGDTVKVEAAVAEDGSVTAQRIETPSAVDALEAATSAPEDLSTPQALVFDDNGNEAFGTVDAITDTSVTVGGQTYTFASGVEIKGDIVAGASVKLHFIVNADGTLSVREIEIADQTQIGDDNSVDDGTGHDANDDGSNHDVNDDNGSDSNHDSNDDNSGGNSGSGG
jgi:hypothetical protein